MIAEGAIPAAAIAGIIKTALAMKHRLVPPTVHFTDPNPLIPFDRLPFTVPRDSVRVQVGRPTYGLVEV